MAKKCEDSLGDTCMYVGANVKVQKLGQIGDYDDMINCILMTTPSFQNVWFATTWVCANYSAEGSVPFSEKPKLNSRNLSQPFYVFSFDTDSEIQLFCGYLRNVLEITKEGDGDYTNWAFLHLYCDPSVAVVPNRRVKRGNITPPTLEIRFRTSPTLSSTSSTLSTLSSIWSSKEAIQPQPWDLL